MMNFYNQFRSITSGEKINCLNCGAVNQTGQLKCENCGAELVLPAPFFLNLTETVIRPMQALPRIAATAPVMQAFLTVLLAVAAYLLETYLLMLFSIEDAFKDYDKFKEQFYALWDKVEADKKQAWFDQFVASNPAPGIIEIVFRIAILLIGWGFFAMALHLTAQLFYRKEARLNYLALLSIVGFARVTYLARFFFLVPIINNNNIVALVATIAILLWQVGLLIIGIRFSTGLSWNRSAMVALIPSLLFQFFLTWPI